ncbi:N-acetylmuramoyl-L-alanine amidase [Streptomyces sp. HNM0574]|uniref:peptidoglycan recognition protein family protein n=1 Tax=Streptomyces sp. HNM0574 TaxID=2714954 RepID=UPI00146E7E12|nr:N-acetylmuramoyl-L-alanine amidase [Streptomyces sp. HNM0574]NLU68880.1 N-acetylmuramoyl-L-alanine amidase [Streptomyces sp. HNM0574]
MTPSPAGFGRRTLLRGGLSATAAGALGLTGGTAYAASPGAGARGAAAEPRVHTTAEWKARPPSSDIVVEDHKPAYIVVHHTVEPGNGEDYSLAHAKRIAREIQDAHMARGWGDTGQQFTNSRGGHVLEGRHRSLEVVRGGRQHVKGANVSGHNSEVVGIENEGLYSEVDVPRALWESLVGLVSWIAERYGTDTANIVGHRDFNSTECPGDVLYGRLRELREAVAASLGRGPVPASASTWPLLRPGSSGPRVRAAQHLLRATGFPSLRADGVFGGGTRRAVARLASVHGVRPHRCSAMRQGADETGYLGADLWPLITPRVPEGDTAEVDSAVQALRRAGGTRTSAAGPLGQADWQRLLAV